MEENNEQHKNIIKVGENFFRLRDYTPIPLILIMLFVQHSSVRSVTFGMLVIMLGELIRLYSVAFIGGVSRTRTSSTGQALVTAGPFGWVRNPLYVGNFFIVLGLGIYCNVLWFLLLSVICFSVQYFFVVKYEENLLFTRFGEEYREYCRQVPPWLPSKWPKLEEIEVPPQFHKALRSEKRTMTAIVAVLALLIFFA